MTKRTPKKKFNRKMRKTIRRTCSAIFMITALIVAAIPVENLRASDQTGYQYGTARTITDLDLSDTIDLSSGNPSVSPDEIGADERAMMITPLSDGSYELNWQFQFYMVTSASGSERGVISKYNNDYAASTVTLDPNVTYQYAVVETTNYETYFTDHAADAYKLNYATYKSTGEGTSPTGISISATEFLNKYFNTEYVAWIAACKTYDSDLAAYNAAIAAGKTATDPTIPGDLVKTVSQLSSDDNKQTYYCDDSNNAIASKADSSTKYSLQGYKLQLVNDYRKGGGTPTPHAYVAKVVDANAASGTRDANGFLKIDTASVIAIGDNAFKDVQNIDTLTIPSEIGFIGESAFYNSFIKTITLVNVSEIGNHAFENCEKLTSITLSAGTQKIGTEAFRNCGAASIKLPSTITTVGQGAFAYCPYLATVDMSDVSSGCVIGDYAFYDDYLLSSVSLSNKITGIGEAAFACVSGVSGALTSFVFPSKISQVATTPIKTGGTSGDKGIGDYILAGRTNLTSCTMPADFGRSTAVTVPLHTFVNCINLGLVTFPDDGSGSCGYASYGSTNSSLFVDVTNPDLYVRGPAYDSASQTATPRKSTWAAKSAVSNIVPYVYSLSGVDYYEASDGTYMLNVNTEGVLSSITLLTTPLDGSVDMVIPDHVGTHNITSIATDAFTDAVKKCLKSITIEDGYITTIADSTFDGCASLESAYIGASVNSIGASAFANCPKLADVTFETPDAGYSAFAIGIDAFNTGGTKLTFHGDIDLNYAPFKFAMNTANYMYKDNGIRILYKSNSPSNLMVIQDNGNGAVTLVGYPHYEKLDSDNGYDELKTVAVYLTDLAAYQAAPAGKTAPSIYDYSLISRYEYLLANPDETGIDLTPAEWKLVEATQEITIPSGVTSVDVKAYIANKKNAGNISTYLLADSHYSTYKNYGLFNSYSGGYTGSDGKREYATTDTANEAVDRGNDRITKVTLNTVSALPDNCFFSCEKLGYVALGTCTDVGEAPFTGCTNLAGIGGNTTYTCDNGIIYSKDSSGNYTIVECLGTRGNSVGAKIINVENDPLLASVTTIKPGAFQNCDYITRVDLSSAAKLESIPDSCFDDCQSLTNVVLPESVNYIGHEAFAADANSNGTTVTIPGLEVDIESNAFDFGKGTIRTYEDSAAYTYGTIHNLDVTDTLDHSYAVYFVDYDGTELAPVQYIAKGGAATAPANPSRTGYTFKGWNKTFTKITADTIVTALYTVVSSGTPGTPGTTDTTTKYTLTVTSGTGGGSYASGTSVTITANTAATGKAFEKWTTTNSSISFASNTSATTTITMPASSATVVANYIDSSKKYTATVNSGTGGGSYASGATVTIVANTPATGKVFDKWTSTSTDVSFASATSATTTFSMLAKDVTVEATYKDATATAATAATTTAAATTTPTTSSSGGTSTGGSSGSGTDNTSGTNNGTTVDISSDAISNKDKASASVDGSTDNFIVKISESAEATAAVEAALTAEYGSLDGLAYLPMDISLYDETGTNKITDTTGLSVNITMPIPDALQEYAGNNKAASVGDGNTLENHTETKFNTIDDVSCISFTASHFSPYTIYADTNNLVAGSVDGSPTTGDPIHPKWFLVIGFACVSIILFLKRDPEDKLKTA